MGFQPLFSARKCARDCTRHFEIAREILRSHEIARDCTRSREIARDRTRLHETSPETGCTKTHENARNSRATCVRARACPQQLGHVGSFRACGEETLRCVSQDGAACGD